MNKRAFVTGGTGFLGTNLLHQLDRQGWQTIALVRPTSQTQYLPPSTEKVIGSLGKRQSLIAALPEGLDVVFHIAGNTSLWKKGDEQQYQDNVVGTENMIHAALQQKVGRFICTSSVAAFGHHAERVTESTPSTAADDWVGYRRTKYLAQQAVLKAVKEKGLDAVILNPCHIIGPYDTSSWAQLIQQVYHKKLPGIPPGTGNFCHVKDVAAAHIKAFEKGRTGELYLLGGHEASFLEFINEIQQLLDRKLYKKASPAYLMKLGLWLSNVKSLFSKKEPDLTPEKVELVTSYLSCDYSKATQELDFQVTPMREMIEDSLNWLKKENKL